VTKYLQTAESAGLPRIASIQNPYNLLNRSFEVGLSEIALREDCGLLAYSPLAAGTLTGKYLHGERPAGSRRTLDGRKSRYETESGEMATQAYVDLARRHGLDPAQMAIAWTLTRPFLTASIIGATSMDQLKTNIGASEVSLSEEIMQAIEDIHARHTYPCP
jgi:aryl-alcohol dehydrogenase-like predicted oxidoreductase